MSIEGDRRAPGATRVPFEGLVEIGTPAGPGFEGRVIDVSQDGMQVKTAVLPELGQPVTCRFEASGKGSVAATAEVVWRDEGATAGSFGLRFTDLDAESEETLHRLVETGGAARGSSGRVRLHIDGLGVAMKARVRDASRTKLTVGNELGFLQLGKTLELEDAESGEKRPASIDRVELELDPETQIPRLVVGLRYSDEAPSEAIAAGHVADSTPEPAVMDPEMDDAAAASAAAEDVAVDEESAKMKSAFARNAAKVTPAILAIAKRAKITAAMLWAKRGAGKDDAAPVRRTTAPPPGGALHAAGRKVVREQEPAAGLPLKLKLDNKRKIALGAALGLASVIAIAAIRHKPANPPEASHPVDTAAAAPTITMPADSIAFAAAPPIMTAPPPPLFMDLPPTAAVSPKPGHVTPFGNGTVTHGNVLHLKMDGAIDKINGASQPTGFSISIPGHKALEPAGPLAARDARIASIKVENGQAGAELDVAFKDGVPNYVVRAKGDTLEIVLAPPGTVAQAKPAPKPGAPAAPATAKKKPAAAPAPAPHKK